MRAGVLYCKEDESGICFDSYPKLLSEIEKHLDRMKYPRANMKLRKFQKQGMGRKRVQPETMQSEAVQQDAMQLEVKEQDAMCRKRMQQETMYPETKQQDAMRSKEAKNCERGETGLSLDGIGQAGVYAIRVTHRRNASWQGILTCCATQEQYRFASFMNLVDYLDGHLRQQAGESGAAERKRENAVHHFERCLSFVMECPERRKLLPDVYLYRYAKERSTQTFIIRPMFYEHDTCQGILYWKEQHQQCRFRSFLELISSISGVLETWDGRSTCP